MDEFGGRPAGRAATRPCVVAAVYVSTVGFTLGVVFGRGEVVLLALAILLALLAISTRTAAEALEECLPLVGKSALLLPPLAVVLVGIVFLAGGILIDRAWVMVAGTVITALGTWFSYYLVAKVGLQGVLNAIVFASIGWSEPVHPRRKFVNWGNRWVFARENDERFYRIEGLVGTGKSHLTRLFILEALKELDRNPYAKVIVYEPKREFYAWLKSMDLPHEVHYFMPSDRRGEALDFGRDFPEEQDAKTLAHAFWPHDPNEKTRFWGDCMRTIFAAVYLVILEVLGRCDMRLVLAVLEDIGDTRKLLSFDPYHASAQILVAANGGTVNETMQNIQLSIHSRVAEMKTLASHLHHAAQDKDALSLREFIHRKKASILVVSKDSSYHLSQDPMNGMLFSRLVQILDKEQHDPRRKIFVVIDELASLAGDKPCPDIIDMFLRLRSRGVVILITYQVAESILKIYGPLGASEIFQQCQNVIWGLQPATPRDGIRGWTQVAVPRRCQAAKEEFHFGPKLVKRQIPKADGAIPEYIERDSSEQRMPGLGRQERLDLGLPLLRFKGGPEK